MVFRENTYSVLIVSSGEKFAASLKSLLPSTDFWPVNVVSTSGEARREAMHTAYDMILINTPLTDEFGTSLAADLCSHGSAGVLLFVKAELYENVYSKVMEAGVMVMSKPAPSQIISQTFRLMCSARERMRSMEARQATVEDKIKEIRLVNKAKWLLIEYLSMTEEQAHHYIEKQAMDMRLSKKECAENIIHTYSR